MPSAEGAPNQARPQQAFPTDPLREPADERFGERLLAAGLIDSDQLRIALVEQQVQQNPLAQHLPGGENTIHIRRAHGADISHVSARLLGQTLVRLGFLAPAQLQGFLQREPHPRADFSWPPDPAALALLPRDFARTQCLLPLRWEEATQTLHMASSNPDDLLLRDRVREKLPAGIRLLWLLADEAELRTALNSAYGLDQTVSSALDELAHVLGPDKRLGEEAWKTVFSSDPRGTAPQGYKGRSATQSGTYSHPFSERPHDASASAFGEAHDGTVRLVEAILDEAIHRQASDIHFEPEAHTLGIRYRIDGLLHPVHSLHRTHWPAIATRLKVLARLDIAESRLPQDGQFSFETFARPFHCRVATLPTQYGEKIALRLLDPQRGLLSLAQLGASDAQYAQLRRLIAHPEGLVLVCGPTGAGKTTTLYALLQQCNQPAVNILTLEDPIEYRLPGIRQTPVSEQLGFADGVRALLRQDPDILLIGEIRDAETARMAFQAATTGHLVLSTLHTRSAVGALPRLLDLGLRAEQLGSILTGIIGQRLLRRLCPACRIAETPSQPGAAETGPAPRFYRAATGCARCTGSGYHGRIALLEILEFSPALHRYLAQEAHPNTYDLARLAQSQGFLPLVEAAREALLRGETSLEEILRVLPEFSPKPCPPCNTANRAEVPTEAG